MLLILCSRLTGDLWRVFPNGSVAYIESESDLYQVRQIRDLEPNPDFSTEFYERQGDRFEVIHYTDCFYCEGKGREKGPAWVGRDEETGDEFFVSCQIHNPPLFQDGLVFREQFEHACCHCGGVGAEPEYTGREMSLAEIRGAQK